MKPVKVAFEGDTLVDERANRDWSREIQVYKKVGVICMMNNAMCVYKDTSLSKEGAFQLKDTVQNVVTVDNASDFQSGSESADDNQGGNGQQG